MGKTNPLNDRDLEEFVRLQANFDSSANSWTVDVSDVDPATFDLSVRNPNVADEVVLRSPDEIFDEIVALDADSTDILAGIRGML
jgi:type I restriction enzyme M protein